MNRTFAHAFWREPTWRKIDSKILPALATCLLLVVWAGFAQAANGPTHRPGKVIIIRGAFTVFSLGMNELGDKLRQYGLDVEVVADVSAGRTVANLASEYQRNPNLGPIVLVGHSRGAELGPKEARTLQQHGIPVKLIVMVDAVHKTSIPANVQRCVNLFQTAAFSLPHGTPATADSRKTKLVNANIAKLKTRSQGGSINHFNMDASPWIHKLVMSEVLRLPGRRANGTVRSGTTGSSNGSPVNGGSRTITQ